MREQKSPRAWVKTARRWDIIGRGIGMGWFRCSPSCVAKGPTFPSPARVQPRKFRKRGATWKWTRKGGGGWPPSKWFSESRQAWDWIRLWRICCRQRTVVTCRTREGKCQRWRVEEKGEFSTFQLSQFAKIVVERAPIRCPCELEGNDDRKSRVFLVLMFN